MRSFDDYELSQRASSAGSVKSKSKLLRTFTILEHENLPSREEAAPQNLSEEEAAGFMSPVDPNQTANVVLAELRALESQLSSKVEKLQSYLGYLGWTRRLNLVYRPEPDVISI